MKKITYILLSACFLLTSCEDFLNRDPDAKVGSGDYFTDEGSLLTYINGFIQKYTPSAADLGYGDGYSDIMATEKSFTFLTNASWTPDLQSGWSISNWTPIYNINYFLVHMREAKGLSEATYNHYEGTARFWRAWQYFEKVKTFGAVPWYDEPIDPEDMVALYKPRDSREYVMERVLEDLNFACEHCYTSSDWINCARINRYIALAYKARVRYLPQIPFGSPVDGQGMGRQAGFGEIPARMRRGLRGTDGSRRIQHREQPCQGQDPVPGALHTGGRQHDRSDLGSPDERRHDHVPRP